jgi:hypothetical protein
MDHSPSDAFLKPVKSFFTDDEMWKRLTDNLLHTQEDPEQSCIIDKKYLRKPQS